MTSTTPETGAMMPQGALSFVGSRPFGEAIPAPARLGGSTSLLAPPKDSKRTAGQTPTAGAPRAPRRDRYIDSLRAVALIRVMTYHTFGWIWLPLIYPSMGIMFALAGSLMASSLDRSAGNPWKVLRKRMVRLLPPLWAYGALIVPFMLWQGWEATEDRGTPLSLDTMLFWVVPVSTPPGSAAYAELVLPLWYIRTYLWLMLLSPAMLWMWRHWPRRITAIPFVILAAWVLGLLPLGDRGGDIVLSVSTFAACWMLGFAHHDGKIRPLPLGRVLAAGAALMACGYAWAVHFPAASGANIDDIPVADALYCLGAVLILLRLYPDFSWMQRHRLLDGLVGAINSRAMTVYLWGNCAIAGASALLATWEPTRTILWSDSVAGNVLWYAGSWVLVGVAVVAIGWVEDVAARRRPRLLPRSGGKATSTRSTAAAPQ